MNKFYQEYSRFHLQYGVKKTRLVHHREQVTKTIRSYYGMVESVMDDELAWVKRAITRYDGVVSKPIYK